MRSSVVIPRFLFGLAITCTLILGLTVILIHNQPFDEGGFRGVIFADGCTVACLMGIQPGITTVDEARGILERGGYIFQWIEDAEPLSQESDGIVVGRLHWRWSSKRPALFTGTDASLMYDLKSGVVVTFADMTTRLSFGQMLILLGQPSVGYLSAGYNDRDGVTFTSAIGYPQWRMSLVSTIQCPITTRNLWDSSVMLQIAPTDTQTARYAAYPAHIQAILGYAYNTFCS